MKAIHATLVLGVLLWSSLASASLQTLNTSKAPFSLPELSYPEDSLSAVIDAETMKIHRNFHHKGYVDKLNSALKKGETADLKTLLANVSSRGDEVRNNAGGHWNHAFFWTLLSPRAEDQKIPKDLEKEIAKTFGSFNKFKEAFEKAGTGRFGSGWVWLIRNAQGKLEITSTPNQDNPLMDVAEKQGTPILGADIWEHAYYLKYQNKRGEYLKNFWKIINWKQVADYDKESRSAG